MVPFSHLHIGGTEIRGVPILPDCIGDRARVSKKHGYPNVVFAWRKCVIRRKNDIVSA